MSTAPLNNTSELPMTEHQRRCLLHILRNSAAALEGLVLLVDRNDCSLTTSELEGCLRGVVRSLVQMKDQLAAGSFCTLTADQCDYVGPFVGCRSSDWQDDKLYSLPSRSSDRGSSHCSRKAAKQKSDCDRSDAHAEPIKRMTAN